MKKAWLCVWLLIWCLVVYGQTHESSFHTDKSISNISLTQWTADDGLSSNNITSVFQDSNGLIWITSFNGFMIYDGERFEVYDKNRLTFLETDGFYKVIEGSDGQIFLASQGSGIVVYDKGEFRSLAYEGVQIPKSIRELYFTSRDELIVGTNNNGAFQIKSGISTKVNPSETLSNSTVLSVLEDKEGTIWLATEGDGLYGIRNDQVLSYTSNSGLLSNIVTSLCLDQNGHLLIATDNGLQKLSVSGQFQTISNLKGIYINNMLLDEWNSLWMGSEKGLAKWNQENDKLEWLYEKKGVDLVRISSMIKDKENSIWLTSNRSGLIHIRASQVENLTFPTLSSDRVYIVHESWDGKLYIGTDQNNVDVCENGNCESIHLKTNLKGNGIRDIYHDRDGSLWLATYIGIIQKHGAIERLYSTATGMPANNFRTVLKDKSGNYWFGSRSGGLVKFKDGKINRVFDHGHGLSSDFVLSVSEASNGDIYVGTHSGGMTIINPQDETKTYFLKKDGSGILFFNIDINADLTAKITANIGPVYFDGDSLMQVALHSDLRSKTFFDMIDDAQGHTWLTTNLGVLRIDNQDWQDYLEGKIPEVPYFILDDNHGMNNKECTGATRSTISKDGLLMVPTLGGVCIFDPDDLEQGVQEPIVKIRHVIVDKNELNIHEERSTIDADAMRFSFEFSVLSYASPDRNVYMYRLEGLDNDWSQPGYISQVEYTNLPPGKYTFKVKGSNESGVWSKSDDQFSFEVLPFFYETIWFYVLIALVIALVLFVVYKWRISFINRKNIELEKVNAELDRFVYSASHEIRSPLSSILGLVNVAKIDTNPDKTEYLNYIEKSVHRLDQFIHDIIDYSRNSRQDLQKQKISLITLVNNILIDISFIENFKKIKYKITDRTSDSFYSDEGRLKIVLSNLITNAFKHHTPDEIDSPFVHIILTQTKKSVKIEIEDNGPGIEKKYQKDLFKMFYRATTRSEGTGLGLYIVAEIIEKMDGKISLKSAPGEGTIFTLVFPIDAY